MRQIDTKRMNWASSPEAWVPTDRNAIQPINPNNVQVDCERQKLVQRRHARMGIFEIITHDFVPQRDCFDSLSSAFHAPTNISVAPKVPMSVGNQARLTPSSFIHATEPFKHKRLISRARQGQWN